MSPGTSDQPAPGPRRAAPISDPRRVASREPTARTSHRQGCWPGWVSSACSWRGSCSSWRRAEPGPAAAQGQAAPEPGDHRRLEQGAGRHDATTAPTPTGTTTTTAGAAGRHGDRGVERREPTPVTYASHADDRAGTAPRRAPPRPRPPRRHRSPAADDNHDDHRAVTTTTTCILILCDRVDGELPDKPRSPPTTTTTACAAGDPFEPISATPVNLIRMPPTACRSPWCASAPASCERHAGRGSASVAAM